MPRSKSSQRWLQEHFDDPYVKKAQLEGYRSRAVYKLQEVDEKDRLIKPGMTIVDLGAAPGGWTEYLVKKMQGRGRIIALDILAMEAIPGADIIQGDFQEEAVLQLLLDKLGSDKVDLVLSDMAPNMSGNTAVDMPKATYLAELAMDFCTTMLKPGGQFFIKLFHGQGFDEYVKTIRQQFSDVKIRKPQASRPRSRETYLLARGYLHKGF